jgi:hypothetical protein
LIVIEGYADVPQEQQHFFFPPLQTPEQVASRLAHLLGQLWRRVRSQPFANQPVVVLYQRHQPLMAEPPAALFPDSLHFSLHL